MMNKRMIELCIFLVLVSSVYASNFTISLNLSTGWNIVPQNNTGSRNLSDLLALYDNNITFVAYWNNTNQSYVSHVRGLTVNDNETVPAGESYFVYFNVTNRTIGKNFSFINRSLTSTFNIGWNLFFNKNRTRFDISFINLTIGENSTIISHWNNTNKTYKSAVPQLSINHGVTIPYLESFWVLATNTTVWIR